MNVFMLITVQSLVARLDHFTPCSIGVNEKKEKEAAKRLAWLVMKIMGFISKNFDPNGQARFVDALLFGAEKHSGGRRANKVTPYFIHCLEVAHFLVALGVLDLDILIAAVLHDCMEDGGATRKEIVGRFGTTVYKLIKLLSKHPDKNMQLFYWDKLRNEPELVIRAWTIIIKFPDRAHSLGTLRDLKDEARAQRIRDETRREFPELHQVLVETLAQLPAEKKRGLPDTLAQDLHTLVFGRL